MLGWLMIVGIIISPVCFLAKWIYDSAVLVVRRKELEADYIELEERFAETQRIQKEIDNTIEECAVIIDGYEKSKEKFKNKIGF